MYTHGHVKCPQAPLCTHIVCLPACLLLSRQAVLCRRAELELTRKALAGVEKSEEEFRACIQYLLETQQQLDSTQHKLQQLQQRVAPLPSHNSSTISSGEFCGFSVEDGVEQPDTPTAVSSPATATFHTWSRLSSDSSNDDSNSSSTEPVRCSSPADSEVSLGCFVMGDDSEVDCEVDVEVEQACAPSAVLSARSSSDLSSENSSDSLNSSNHGGAAGKHSRRDSVDSCCSEVVGDDGCIIVPDHCLSMDRSSSNSACMPAKCVEETVGMRPAVSYWGGLDLWCVAPAAPAPAAKALGAASGGSAVAAAVDGWSVLSNTLSDVGSSVGALFSSSFIWS